MNSLAQVQIISQGKSFLTHTAGLLARLRVIKRQLQKKAQELGFLEARVTSPYLPPHFHATLKKWIEKGHHGEMRYMERTLNARKSILEIFPSARSVVVVTMGYFQHGYSSWINGEYRIARYAAGIDYHITMKKRMRELLAFLNDIVPCDGKIFVDSAPVLERAYGMMAGTGWIGKNTMLISPRYGSYFLIGIIALDIFLPRDAPFTKDMCGRCTKCIRACPTKCINNDRTIDATKCISYATIELPSREDIPEAIAQKMEGWLFGCDICQEVCPWNRFSVRARSGLEVMPFPFHEFRLVDWLSMGSSCFRRMFGSTPLARAGAKGMRRNARALLKWYQYAGNKAQDVAGQ